MKNQQKVWDEIADDWKDYRTEVSPSVRDFLKDKKGKILDLGCGSGRNFMKLNDVEWYGVDFSDKMLKFAEKRADKLEIRIKLKKEEVYETGFEDGYFDCVLCFAVLHCIYSPVKRKKVMKEIFRILKPNCEALISCWGEKSPRLRNKEKECFVPWNVRGSNKKERYTYVFNLKELEDLAKNVGFEIVRSWEERNVNIIVRKT